MNQEAVDKAHDQWLEAMKANDPAALGRLVTDDVVLMPPHGEPIVGRHAVVEWFANVVRQARTKDVNVTQREVMVAGDLAIERGSFTWKVAPAGRTSDVEDRGNFVAIWKRQSDGSWKTLRNIWNSTLPEPAVT